MEFGKVSDAELLDIDFTLPPDPPSNRQVLSKGRGNTQFHIGCAKWGRKDWVGSLYPPGSKEKDFLELYAQIFNSIEFNATFYKPPTEAQVLQWKSKVGSSFKFCPKFTQTITHLKRLKDTGPQVDQFLSAISAFGDNLGPIFLMPNPQMGLTYRDTIESFIADFPKDAGLFLELRHPEWYTQGYDPQLLDFLIHENRGTIITDASGRRDCAHMHLTTPECFIRFVGNSLHPTDYQRIDAWVDRLGQWMDQGLEHVYFFMHQHEELHSPELIRYFIEQMNARHNTKLEVPRLQSSATLF